MRLVRLAALLLCGAAPLFLARHAFAYARPDAVSLSAPAGGGWELLSAKPLTDLVKDRSAKPDFPQLAPSLDDAIPGFVREGLGLPRGGDWQGVAVPAAWEQALGIDYNGAGWYRRTVDIPSDWRSGPAAPGRRVWLEFDSVATVAGVWVNGRWCGGNVGDFTRWRVEITDALHPQAAGGAILPPAAPAVGRQPDPPPPNAALADKAAILIYVDELPGHITQGFPSMIGPHYGGIWQDCRLYSTGPASVAPDGVQVRADAATGAVVVECDIASVEEAQLIPRLFVTALPGGGQSGAGRTVYASATDPAFSAGVTSEGRALFKFKLKPQDVQTWSPDRPALYELRLELRRGGAPDTPGGLWDSVRQRFAFRTVTTRGYQLLLNGQPLYLRSALNWGWYPGAVAPLPTPDTVRDEFRQIKALGFNAETVCLAVLPDYFYDIADEEGVLLWQEYPAWHNPVTPALRGEYLRLYGGYFRRDANHPSLVLRSLTCENGDTDAGVMGDLVALGKKLTGTPLQDNTSWLGMSRPALTDWYDEHNYFNCNQWVQYTLDTLPAKLDTLPDKPFLIGESLLFNTWPDTAALLSTVGTQVNAPEHGNASADAPTHVPAGDSTWPYWFPKCFDSVLGTEAGLRARYNADLPGVGGRPGDIVRDYLLPESYAYSLESRKFQMGLLHASPRYAGYTMNVVRDMPLVRAGLLDDLGRPRWKAADWAWQADQQSKVQLDAAGKVVKGSKDDLLAWDKAWDKEIDSTVPVMVYSVGTGRAAAESSRGPHAAKEQSIVRSPQTEPTVDPAAAGSRGATGADRGPRTADGSGGGNAGTKTDVETPTYRDIAPWFADWQDVQAIAPGALKDADPLKQHSPVVVTPVLTTELADYAQRGGVVVVCSSQWPGGLGSYPHFFWRDSIFVPPVGPWFPDAVGGQAGQRLTDRIVQLQPYDLNRDSGDVLPVQDLGIADDVDPLLRLFDTHDLSEAATYDQLFATRVGKGLLVASSLDHGTDAGQWVLSKVLAWALVWKLRELQGQLNDFPRTTLSAGALDKLTVARANGILDINAGWRFATDPRAQGEAQGWAKPEFDDKAWQTVTTGQSWESFLGKDYDGMGWYRRRVSIPADWAGGKVRLVCEGVDDAYVVWVNGRKVGSHGSFTDHDQTVWQQETLTDITAALKPGQDNTIVLQVVDIVGQGGVWKPVYLALE